MTNKYTEVTPFFSVSIVILILFSTACFGGSSSQYDPVEISYFNSHDGIRLSGTLTIPTGDKHCPAVLLIQGSGSHNRDEELLRLKPFEVIANYLANRGVAVLRVDRRGCGKSEGTYLDLDMEHYIQDAVDGK